MKKINSLFVLTVVALTFSTITAQFTSVKDGEWRVASTWSTDPSVTALPDSNSSVIVNHILSTAGGDVCRDLSINGKVWGGEYLHIYGDLINKGELRDQPDHGSDYLTVTINGSIINDGLYIAGTTKFEGSADHHLRTYNGNIIHSGFAQFKNSSSSVIIDSVAYISGNWMLGGSKLILPGGYATPDTLVLIDIDDYYGGLIDGGVIECNNNVIKGKGIHGTIGFSGLDSFGKQHTTVKDAILEGYININGSFQDSTIWTTSFSGNFVNNGTIITAPHNSGNYANIFIENEFTNNGIVQSQSTGLDLRFVKNGSITNNGELVGNKMLFYGSHSFTNNSDSVSVIEIKGLDASSTVQVIGNLIFNSDVNIDMLGGTMILPNNGKLINFGMTNTILEANNSILATRSNSDFRYGLIENAKIEKLSLWYQSKLKGECEIVENGVLSLTHQDVKINANLINNGEVSGNNIDSAIVGNITNNGIWKINSKLKGTILNNGTIDNYNFTITGDITNNGSWKSISSIELNGSEDQIISMPTDSTIHTNMVKFNSMLDGINYQWQRNGEDIENAISSFYTIYGVGLLPDNATYHCTVDGINSRSIIIQSLTDVEENNVVSPTEYSLSQNYPNPFNPSTVIEFAIPEKTNLSLTVFNSIGEEVAKLVNQEMTAGYHSVNFNATSLSSGIYFYRIRAGNFTKTNKMILLR